MTYSILDAVLEFAGGEFEDQAEAVAFANYAMDNIRDWPGANLRTLLHIYRDDTFRNQPIAEAKYNLAKQSLTHN